MTDEVKAEMDGLEMLQGMIARGRSGGIGQTLGFALVEVERGRVVVEGTPDRSVYNPLGIVHGGYAATLLDTACGLSTQSALGPSKSHTTLELKISYLRALTDKSGTVRAVGTALNVGRRVGFAEATLHDGEGRLCATATSTLLVLDMKT
jgi:uncharacterized protein (TIGR00369 family)